MHKSTKIIIIFSIILLVTLGIIFNFSHTRNQASLSIIATNFPAYDFARAITGDTAEIKMLIKPGTEPHDFEPTPQDIIDINNSQLFIYTGGESDEWIKDIIRDIDPTRTQVYRMMDAVTPVEESIKEGMESPHEEQEDGIEYDEHVWTSPKNAIKIINSLKDKFIKISPQNQAIFEKNTKSYTDQLSTLDQEIQAIIDSASRKVLVFGDRFPLRYFVDDYGLDYYAAFPGCSEQTEANSTTIAFLIDKVKSKSIPVVFKTEMSSDKIARTIADETGAKILEFNAAHHISLDDFNSGLTYLDIMKNNLAPLREALK